MEKVLYIDTPAGHLGISADEHAVTGIFFANDSRHSESLVCTFASASLLLKQAARELSEYFAGTRREFTIPLAPAGTPFQQTVWKALQTIPYGETRTYGEIAMQIGRPKACRAVGMSNHRNPISIVIPCHRVVGSDGKLTGYAGGLDVKTLLLNLEQQNR